MNKAIGSISQMSAQNHRIVFDDCGEGSYMRDNATGDEYRMTKEENGDYILELEIMPYVAPF